MSIKLLAATLEYIFETHRHQPLQTTRWSGNRESLTFTGTSQRITLPTGAVLIEIVAAQDCYLNFGGSSVVATTTIATDGSRLFLAGTQVVPVILDSSNVPFTHVAIIQSSAGGIIQIEEQE